MFNPEQISHIIGKPVEVTFKDGSSVRIERVAAISNGLADPNQVTIVGERMITNVKEPFAIPGYVVVAGIDDLLNRYPAPTADSNA